MAVNLKYPNKQTDIICTIGPSSWDPAVMQKMIEVGMNVARVNGAFADNAELEKVETLVRSFSPDVRLMLDVKGPEVRMNKFPEALKLEPGMEIEIGSSEKFPIYPANYPDLYQKLQPGNLIVVGDGDVRLEVTQVLDASFKVKVIYGKLLKSGKALNFPGLILNEDPLTEKDKGLIEFIRNRNWDYVSASFIRSAKDAQHIREYLGDSSLKLVAKIEDATGVKNLEEILPVVDGVMIARGGLGVEIGLEYVGLIERYLLDKCIAAGKYVITATQMLESMTDNPIPTRAEAHDVMTAILLNSDAVMLSGESSAGKYPVEAVEFMSRVDALVSEVKSGTDLDYAKLLQKL
jgi:pyruvate kinase